MHDHFKHPNGAIAALPRSLATEAGEVLNFHLVSNPEDYGFFPWSDAPIPEHDPSTHKAEPRDVDDAEARTSTRLWDIVALTEEEIEAAKPPVPVEISDRQFAQQLALEGAITEAEAIDWVGPGTVPASVSALVDLLPEDQRFAARMLLKGATSFERAHPLTAVMAGAYGWSPGRTDDFWRAAALL